MRGMMTRHFSGWSTGDFAVSHSYHLDLAPAAVICELSLTSANENADQAGSSVGFLSYTFTDPDGTPHEVPIPFGDRLSVIGHNRIIRVDWYLRIYGVNAAGLLNVFVWDSVS